MQELKERIESIDDVDQVRTLTYQGEGLTTVVVLVREENYSAWIQDAIIDAIEVFSKGRFDWHIAEVEQANGESLIDDTVWSIEVAPIYAGNLPEDVDIELD